MAPALELLLPEFAAVDPAAVIVWSGAGASVDAPTCGPTGLQVVARAVEHAFADDTVGVLASYYRQLRLNRTGPRLETVLEIVHRVHGDDGLLDLLNDLERPPNDLHRFFAAHVAMGGHHITTNFDTCIERAGSSSRSDVLHVHGSLEGGHLGATLGRIERGLAADMRSAIDRVLLRSDVELVVVVGYSGSDFFDVDPYLSDLRPGTLDGRRVVWLTHDGSVRAVVERRRQLCSLENAGARTAEIRAPTRQALSILADAWGLPILGPAPQARSRWMPHVMIDQGARQRASLELCALMGLHREIDERIAPYTADHRSLADASWAHEILAHTRWAQGRYRAAGRAWDRARTEATPAARAERKGAVLWIRGEYRRARDVLVAALELENGTRDEQLLLAEALARVYDHASRYKSSRHVATRSLLAFIEARLPDPGALAASGQPVGTHIRARVASARQSLGIDDVESSSPVESFGEFEALSAQLLYRQGDLRSRAAHGEVAAELFHTQRNDLEVIGAFGDAARATLLGGPRPFSLIEVLRAGRALDVTRWHRVRLIAMSLKTNKQRRRRC
jgi:hypothetical protein